MNDPTIYRPDVVTGSALATLEHWTSMAAGAFAANTIRAWQADWESRGVTVGDLRDVVNPSLGRTHAFDGWPRMDTQGLRGAGSEAQCCGQNFPGFCDPAAPGKPVGCRPWQTPLVACDEPCFSRRGDHPPSLHSTPNEHNGHEAAITGAIRNSTISGARPL
jgi:hypothetical protein